VSGLPLELTTSELVLLPWLASFSRMNMEGPPDPFNLKEEVDVDLAELLGHTDAETMIIGALLTVPRWLYDPSEHKVWYSVELMSLTLLSFCILHRRSGVKSPTPKPRLSSSLAHVLFRQPSLPSRPNPSRAVECVRLRLRGTSERHSRTSRFNHLICGTFTRERKPATSVA
jgi:hypothetical protein